MRDLRTSQRALVATHNHLRMFSCALRGAIAVLVCAAGRAITPPASPPLAAIRRASSFVSSLAIFTGGLTRLWVALIGCGRLWR